MKMSEKGSAQDVIERYRRRQQSAQRAPLILGLAALVLLVGAGLLIFWLLGPNRPAISLFATDTPTPTVTPTATATATATAVPTATPTETETPTATLTPTASGPFQYVVVEGDYPSLIADKFKVDLFVLLAINNLDPANPVIHIGDTLTIPGPNTTLPTATQLPANIPRGTKIEYTVQLNDTLAIIAEKFLSTVEAIIKENNIEDANAIFAGQKLVIPVNIATPVPTKKPPTPTVTGTIIKPAAPTATGTTTP
jgi:LysM repeat protein